MKICKSGHVKVTLKDLIRSSYSGVCLCLLSIWLYFNSMIFVEGNMEQTFLVSRARQETEISRVCGGNKGVPGAVFLLRRQHPVRGKDYFPENLGLDF